MIETHSSIEGRKEFKTLREAFKHVDVTPSVNLVVINLPTGERIELARHRSDRWDYQPIAKDENLGDAKFETAEEVAA